MRRVALGAALLPWRRLVSLASPRTPASRRPRRKARSSGTRRSPCRARRRWPSCSRRPIPASRSRCTAPARERILQRVMQELQADIKNVDVVHTSDAGHFVLLKDKKLLTEVHARRASTRFPAGFKDQRRLLLRPARHRERDRLQHQGGVGGRGAEDVEGPARPQVEGQDGHRAPGLQRGHRHPRAGPGQPVRLGLLQAARPEPADARAVGRRSVRRRRLRASGAVAVDGGEYTFYQTKKKGNPIEIVYPKEGVPLVVSPTAITSVRAAPERGASSSPTSASAARSSR